MIKDITDNKEVFTAINAEVLRLHELFSSVERDKINAIPYKDSWTAAQLVNHVTKSINAMATAMLTPTKTAERDSIEKIPWLKKIFLDTENVFNAPDFIVPDAGPYEKDKVLEDLKQSYEQLKKNTEHQRMDDIVSGLPIGEVTKLEILHFVLYHTQRHIRQMQKICISLYENI